MQKFVNIFLPYFLCMHTRPALTSLSRHLAVSNIKDLSISTAYNNNLLNYTYVMTSSHTSSCELAKSLSEWAFSCSKLSSLPMDPIKENYVRRNVQNAVFSFVTPTPIQTKLQLVDYSDDALINLLDMDPAITTTNDFVEFVAGNKILTSCIPMAHRYGGHQFGVWASQLGDGRAILLGEYKNRAGERWELQLKGSGLTPYSRGGDGRAVLRSSIREFLCAEAMYYLGVPTSRVAALITSNDGVLRDPLYNGQPIYERASVVLRLSPTWYRIGSLEILAKQGEIETLKTLVRHILDTILPGGINMSLSKGAVELGIHTLKTVYDTWIHWQRVGFTHGVLNSDNISLLGVTIDYGPFGFMSEYNPRYVPNLSDSEARYCFERQIDAIYFDLEKLRSALEILIMSSDETMDVKGELVKQLAREFNSKRQEAETNLNIAFLAKIGLKNPTSDNIRLPPLLLLAMEETKADYTATFRQLGEIPRDQLLEKNKVKKYWALHQVSQSVLWSKFVESYISALTNVNETERTELMSQQNPCYVLRNWMAQKAIEKAEKDDFGEVRRLQKILKQPYTKQEEAEKLGYSGQPPSWEKQLKVSCSS